jgi:hypothetical protein
MSSRLNRLDLKVEVDKRKNKTLQILHTIKERKNILDIAYV